MSLRETKIWDFIWNKDIREVQPEAGQDDFLQVLVVKGAPQKSWDVVYVVAAEMSARLSIVNIAPF